MVSLGFKSFIFALAIFWVPSVFAQNAQWPAPPPGFRAGMEVELLPEHFSKLTHLFDFDSWQREWQKDAKNNFLPTFYDDYLRNNFRAFYSLPANLQAELGFGLKLEKLTLDEEAPRLTAPKLEIAARKVLSPGAPLFAPKPALDLSRTKGITLPVGKGHEVNGLLRPARMDWEILFDRWNKLSIEKKQEFTRWEFLSPQKKAELVLNVAASARDLPDGSRERAISTLKIKSDVPPEIQNFFEKLEWHIDGSAIEFTHRHPVSSPRELFDDFVRLGHFAGVEKKVLNTLDKSVEGVAVHFHMSVEGKDFSKGVAELINDRFFLERVSQGIISDLTGGNYVYSNNLHRKGLVKLVGNDHIEIRVPGDLDKEIRRISNLVSLPEAEAIAILQKDIKALLTNEMIEQILKYGPEKILKFHPLLSDSLQKKLATDLEKIFPRALAGEELASRQLNEYLLVQYPGAWPRLKKAFDAGDEFVQVRISAQIKFLAEYLPTSHNSWPSELYEMLPKAVRHFDPFDHFLIMLILCRQPDWPPGFWSKFQELSSPLAPAQQNLLRKASMRHMLKAPLESIAPIECERVFGRLVPR